MATARASTKPKYSTDANEDIHLNAVALQMALAADDAVFINYTRADVTAWAFKSKEELEKKMQELAPTFEVLTRCAQAQAYLVMSKKLVPILRMPKLEAFSQAWDKAFETLIAIVGCAEAVYGDKYPHKLFIDGDK
jgi:hypothetical protein